MLVTFGYTFSMYVHPEYLTISPNIIVYQKTIITGVTQVVLTGVKTNHCVEGAVRDAADKGFLVTLVPDACAALTQIEHDQSVKAMTDFARICSPDDIVREINDW